MPTERDLSPAEMTHLQQMLHRMPTTSKRWREGIENAVVLWSVTLLSVVIAWAAIAWIIRAVSSHDVGLASPSAIWIIAIAVPLCGIWAIASSVRWIREWSDPRPSLEADLKNGRVVQEHYSFRAVKRFRDPVRGSVLCCLQTEDDKVFILYDTSDSDFRIMDETVTADALRIELLLTRAPESGIAIDMRFSGDPLPLGELHELTADPRLWPSSEECFDMPWDKLESYFTSTRRPQ